MTWTTETQTGKKPATRLKGFNNYDAFLRFSRMHFSLEPTEYQGLYQVLLKLQSVGQDPMEAMLTWKAHEDGNEMIRFMIMIDQMDMETLQQAA